MMKFRTSFLSCLVVVCLGMVPPATASLFNRSKTPEYRSLDGTLTIVFPFRSSIDFDPKQLGLVGTYEAANPREWGVKKITEKHSNRAGAGALPGAIFTSRPTYKLTYPVKRTLDIKPEWIQPTGPTSFTVALPERLTGPGDYRLTSLVFGCTEEQCLEQGQEGRRSFTFVDGVRESPISGTISLGDKRANTLTADYNGVRILLKTSLGSHDRKGVLSNPARDYRNVQDASGNWHISDSAYDWRYISCDGQSKLIDAENSPTLTWGFPFTTLHQTIVQEPWPMSPPSTFTGCVRFKAEDSGAGHDKTSETRTYRFRDGKLFSRDIFRWSRNERFEEKMEFDGDQPLFYSTNTYVRNKPEWWKPDVFFWNRLEHEAYPQEVGPADPAWGTAAVLDEARKLLEFVALN